MLLRLVALLGWSFALAWALTLAACCCFASPPDDETAVKAEPDPGWVLFTEMETRLLRAKTLEVHAVLTTTGAIEADAKADLYLGEGQRAHFAARGTFQGKRFDALYVSDGTHAWVRGAPAVPAPPEVRDAFVRGLVAMGLMHNVAVLVGGGGPDHAEGGVHDYVKADRPRLAPEGLAVDLDVVVRNKPMGEARIVIDQEGRPKQRAQTVHFETGDMMVVEQYSVVLDGALDPALFAIPMPADPATDSAVAPAPAG